jgi:hypothetical protein
VMNGRVPPVPEREILEADSARSAHCTVAAIAIQTALSTAAQSSMRVRALQSYKEPGLAKEVGSDTVSNVRLRTLRNNITYAQ